MYALKGAIHKLKEINWLYKEVDEDELDDVAREVIETVSDTSSTMLERASKEDVAGFQSFTIRKLNSKQSTSSDIDQYKLVNVKGMHSTIGIDISMSCDFLTSFPAVALVTTTHERFPSPRASMPKAAT